MNNTYFPKHSENRMNKYIKADDKVVVELGCGAGLSKQLWVDRYMDALNVDYPDGSIDVVICSHMLHHLVNPAAFFDDISRKLRSGGRIIIQDIYVCTLMKMALRLMRHEGAESVNVFDREVVCNDPSDPWSANCAIPKLLFGGDRFLKEFPQYRIIKRTRNECFLFFLSGGVIAKTLYLPMGDKGAEFIKKIDQILTKAFPSFLPAVFRLPYRRNEGIETFKRCPLCELEKKRMTIFLI